MQICPAHPETRPLFVPPVPGPITTTDFPNALKRENIRKIGTDDATAERAVPFDQYLKRLNAQLRARPARRMIDVFA